MVSISPRALHLRDTTLEDDEQLIRLFLELSISPPLNHQLVPPHMRDVLASRGLDINNFTPMSKQEMMAKLD